MPVRGAFDGAGVPWVEAIIVLPRLSLRGVREFMVDTGADTTVLSRSAAESIGVDLANLRDPTPVRGIGGTTGLSPEPATIVFSDDRHVMSFDIEIGIPEKVEHGDGDGELPSLLGRDIINQLVMVYDLSREKLEFVLPLPERQRIDTI